MLPFVHFPVLSPLILLHSLVLGALFLPRTFAFPIPRTVTLESLLSFEDYNSFQISGGVGGNALEEAQSIFQGEPVAPRSQTSSPPHTYRHTNRPTTTHTHRPTY